MVFINILLSATLFLIMVSVGSSIELNELKKVFSKPKRVIIGLIAQVLLLPAFAFLIAAISGLPVEYKIGIIILAACPGGTMSNFISYIIKADIPLSIGLTSTNSLIILLTIPFYLALSFAVFLGNFLSVTIPVLTIISQVLFLLIIPVLIGTLFRKYKTKQTLKLQKPIKIIASILLIIFFVIKFFFGQATGGAELPINTILTILPWVLALNIGGLLIGYVLSKSFNYGKRTSTTMGIEVGLQNTVLALVITDVVLAKPLMGHPALIYALFTFWTTLAFGYFILRKKSQEKAL
jgi:bile acid:Na+ symporter, BASS family